MEEQKKASPKNSVPSEKEIIEERKSEIVEFVASDSAGPRVLVVDDQEFNC